MRVRINGVWYDSTVDHIALEMTKEEQGDILSIKRDEGETTPVYYGAFPDNSSMSREEMISYVLGAPLINPV